MPPKRTALLIDDDAERAKLRAARLADVFDVHVDTEATGGKDCENGDLDLILLSSSRAGDMPPHDPHTTTCFVILEDDREATEAADFISAGACDVLRAPLDAADLELRLASHGARRAAKEELATGVFLCRQCHRGIHKFFDEMTLAKEFSSLEQLKNNPQVQRHVSWVKKQRQHSRSSST